MSTINHTKFGMFMINILNKISIFLFKHKWLYYILNYTWGFIMTFIGILASFIMRISGHHYVRVAPGMARCYFVTDNMGGLSLGTSTFVSRNMDSYNTWHIQCHEDGHTYQNAILGPFSILLVFIPSVIRYWYRYFKEKKGYLLNAYDSVWFEDSATQIGELHHHYAEHPISTRYGNK